MRARRWLRPLALMVALPLAVLEVTLWAWLTSLGRLLGRLPLFAWLERLVARMSPNAVVVVFVLPFIPAIPLLKFGELWLLREGHFIWAAVVILGAKVVGAAFSTRVFAIAKPKMMQVAWFARGYALVTGLVEMGHRALEALPGWVAAREAVHAGMAALRARMKRARGPLMRRLAAARRWWRGKWG
ncbi:hypothetical protein KTR66_23535 [Roseococcus sp. SDR]|uniref:hypothetical protein n=1 Tax=Roseococcus sp. SDR TaxID=2835532 RepID=UPI001BCCA73E|nr:hypothetical protein [Roseococcus sp. SDR]MBS7792978.1 hypothetical protein [Roseococcus sp. SDR]MBV1848292.1 hypothetical protein [Roseococcus sp. SDR]